MKRTLILVAAAVLAVGLAFLLLLPRESATDQSGDEPPSRAEAPALPKASAREPGRKAAVRPSPSPQDALQRASRTRPSLRQRDALEDAEPEAEEPGEPQASVWPTDAAGIKGAVQESTPALKACYAATLEKHPDAAGRIDVTFTISVSDTAGGMGHVSALDILESQLQLPELEECLLQAMSGLQFDPPKEDMEVNYPFIFAAE